MILKLTEDPQFKDPGVRGYVKTNEMKVSRLYLYRNPQMFR